MPNSKASEIRLFSGDSDVALMQGAMLASQLECCWPKAAANLPLLSTDHAGWATGNHNFHVRVSSG